jgi:hypothetical protein
MNHSVFRVNAVNAYSIITLAVVFAIIFCTIAKWRVGTPRLVAFAIVAVVLALIAVHMFAAKIRLGNTHLRIGGGLYQVEVPWTEVVGISQAQELSTLRWRKNGIGLPGFALGWFSSADGRKVFAARGRAQDAFRIRLRGQFDAVVGVEDRDALLENLEKRFPRSRE